MSRLKNIAVPGMPFGKGTVIDPEVRVTERPAAGRGTPYRRRYARLLCNPERGGCGAVYLGALTYLFSGRTKCCPACARKRERRLGGRVKPSGRGFTVELYAGYYPTRKAAEEAARQARVVFLPKQRPKAL